MADKRMRSKYEYDIEEQSRESKYGKGYKWIALSNTTLGALMSAINGSILIISLPALFTGMGVNPLLPSNIALLLWLLLGYTIASTIMMVSIGRLSDMFGRVKLYNMGFLIFTICAILLYISSVYILGTVGVLVLIILRIFQGFGSAFLFANGTAIITDAFPYSMRGRAMGFNQIAGVGGSLVGLLLGGVLAAIDWHLIFLVSVPIGIFGTVWAYLMLHEIAIIKKGQKFDLLGNVSFAVMLLSAMLAMTYGLLPYGNSTTGWGSPWIILMLLIAAVALITFVFSEKRAKEPMFRLNLFRIRAFAAGNISMLLAGIARGGLQFMLVIWLQGIWLPLHGVSFENTPLQSAIDMTPLVIGFLVAGPISGYLSDRYGARTFSTLGMVVNVVGFIMLSLLPANFVYWEFAAIIAFLGIGQGLFAAPNTAAIMNSLPPEQRGSGSGMRATLVNASFMLSLVVFFTLLIIGMAQPLTSAVYNGLTAQGVSAQIAHQVASLPPTSALFSALLGYNPFKTIIPKSTLANMSQTQSNTITGTNFFPSIISKPFMDGMQVVLYLAAGMAFVAAIASALRGKRYIRELDGRH
ncbi:MAG: MFS transporter [Candidatus Marsarchaeota archaeon]|nr:MFS transporter [Candidatus Marsarchaeota archaeon]